jgi:hypothetical protein
MNKLDPHFGAYTGSATADTDNSISKIRAEVSALFWSAKILEQLKDPSASMQRTFASWQRRCARRPTRSTALWIGLSSG